MSDLTFGEKLLIARKQLDLYSYQMAELLGVRGNNSFYHNNAIWPWRIATDGEVTNANA